MLVIVRNGRPRLNDIGIWVKDDNVEVTSLPEISGNRIGIQIDGNNNKVTDNNHIINQLAEGIVVSGNNKQNIMNSRIIMRLIIHFKVYVPADKLTGAITRQKIMASIRR